MKALTALIAAALLLTATSVSAAVVDFDDVVAPNSGTTPPFDNGGLTFSSPFGMFLWDGGSPNSNGTNNLIFSDFGGLGEVTITRTGGGTFDLTSFDLAISWYSTTALNSILVNGLQLDITSTLATYVLNLTNVTSVTLSGLFDDTSNEGINSGYWSADNIVYEASIVPLPAALPLMLLALGGLGVAARRRRSV